MVQAQALLSSIKLANAAAYHQYKTGIAVIPDQRHVQATRLQDGNVWRQELKGRVRSSSYWPATSGRVTHKLRLLGRVTKRDGDEGDGQSTDSSEPKEESTKGSLSAILEDGAIKEDDGSSLQEELEKERQRSADLKQELQEVEKKVKEQETLLEDGGERPAGRSFLSNFSASLKDAVDSLESTLGFKTVDYPILEKLDLAKIRKVCSQYSSTGFYMTELRRYGTGVMVVGNLRCSTDSGPTACLDDVAESTRKRLSEALGVELGVWFLVDSITEQTVLVVQPLAEVAARMDSVRLKGIRRWPLAVTLMVLTCFTITSVSGVNLDPNGAQRDIFTSVFPLAGGLWAVLTVGEIFQRIMAKRYGVKLSPPYLIPSNWLGCLGIATRIESFIPSKAALFDIAASRAVGGWIAALALTIAAFLLDGGVNGGSNPLYVEPTFFQPNLLLSFIQYVIGPYADELGNVLPHAVPGLGVPVNPLAFAGLLGLVITSLNLLPAGQLEGGRIIQALFGRKRADQLTTITIVLLGVAGIFGSVLCLISGFIIAVFRNGQELPALDEVSEVGRYRLVLGWLLLGGCILMLLPNSAGTFPSTFFTPPSFYGDF